MANSRICSIPGCGKPREKRDWCNNHYQRFRRNGHPEGGRVYNGSLLDFIENVALVHVSDDCLIWPYGRSDNGYGTLRVDGVKWYAHRYTCFRQHGAPLVADMDAAHSCGNGNLGCVNPKHLRWATRTENVADSIAHGTFRGIGYR